MAKGNNPYVLDKNGKAVATQQHHYEQNANGPIFEMQTTKHQNSVFKEFLHPFGDKKNPYNPVNHKEWKIDRMYINNQRAKEK